MARHFFNGISNLSFDGQFFSFSLDDTYQTKQREVKKEIVVNLISDLETVENVCKFIVEEISTIKKTKNVSETNQLDKPKNKDRLKRSKTRLKLKTLDKEHSD
jgi:hypothetical protein